MPVDAGTEGAFDLARARPAPFGRRFAALLLDWVLCLAVSTFYANPMRVAWPAVLVLIVLNTICIGLFGQTPGMAVTRVRCVSLADGGAIGLARAFVRAILLALLIPAVFMDADGRGLHDRAANSVVIEKPGAAQPSP
jgi:hypothetical protein